MKSDGYAGKFSYQSLHKELSTRFQITRTYFYDAIKSRQIEPQQYANQQAFHERLKKEIPGLVIKTRKLKYLLKNDKLDEARKKAGFCKNCETKLEGFLSEAGLLKATKEKGIDILLVTDMISGAYTNQFQTALLATGDADYVPAVELIKKLKKAVINIHFYSNSAAELREKSNSHNLIKIGLNGNCYFA